MSDGIAATPAAWDYRNKKVVVTGATGLIGRNLVDRLIALGTRLRNDPRPGPAMSPIERVVISARTRAGAGQSGLIILQLLEQSLHVGGQRRLPGHGLAALRMHQGKLRRMQGLAWKRQAVARAAPIDGVADQRMADVLEMHADLVRAAGLQPAFDERGVAETLDDAVGGARRLAAVVHRHARARARVASDRRVASRRAA